MRFTLQLHDVARSEALEARIRNAVAELAGLYPQLSACHVAAEKVAPGPAEAFCVRLDLRFPEHQSLLNGEPCASLDLAIRSAFNAAKRRLEELARRRAARACA
jgi:hypothetical protein